ncbi:MAG: hypothetical protein AAGI34_06040 [Pseudomonadota bacterium]
MPGTLKLWWHDGSTLDVRAHPTPLINEPERAYETLSLTTTPATTGPAPERCFVAAIETDVDLRYRVLLPGQTGSAADPEAKPMPRTGFRLATIGVQPGATLSVVEVA